MINEIINHQQAFHDMAKGFLPDIKDARDYNALELMGAAVEMPPFSVGFDATAVAWPNMPNKHQVQQFSCVGQAWAHYKQVLQDRDTGEHTELSAKSIYNPIAVPGVGSYLRDGGLRSVSYGVNKESTVPSGGTELQVTTKMDFTPFASEAGFYMNSIVATVNSQNFDVLGRMIFQNQGFVSGWKNHAQYFKAYGILQGKRFLKTHGSYGPGSDMYFFEGMGNTLFSSWTAVDLKNNIVPVQLHKIRLVRGEGETNVWFLMNGKRYLVSNPTMMQDGLGEGVWDGFAGVEVIPVLDLRQFPIAKIPFSDYLKVQFAK